MAILDSFRRIDGKSLAYFANDSNQLVSDALLRELKEKSDIEKRNVRLCLHRSPNDDYHDMILLERVGTYFPPHRHLTKTETIHIIEGTLEVSLYDNMGRVTVQQQLTPGGIIVWRVGAGQWHYNRPVSDYVIFHESKCGPFLGDAENEIYKFTSNEDYSWV